MFALEEWFTVLQYKSLFGVMITAYGPNHLQELDVTPGQVQLIIQEAAPGAGRKKMMVVMPFPGNVSRPQLIDRKILPVKVDSFPVFVLSLSVSFIVERTNPDGPETCRPE
jgi:hypothetical protein